MDTLLLEMGADVETAREDKCAIAFKTFDEILPQLGVYVRLMRRVRNILFSKFLFLLNSFSKLHKVIYSIFYFL